MARLVKIGGNFITVGGGLYGISPPSIAVSLETVDLYEGNIATFVVTASKVWDEDITFDYATSNGTGSAGTDYTNTSGTATITVENSTVSIDVPTINRGGSQADRTFNLVISNARSAGDTLTISDNSATATIQDIDEAPPPLPTIAVNAVATVDEGNSLVFRVTASFIFVEDITFNYATSNGTAISGSDYTSISGTAVLLAGNSSVDLPNVVTALRSGYQGPRTVIMTISSAVSETAGPVTISDNTAIGTIAETEAPTGDHGYYDSLIARGDLYRAHSFRSQSEINTYVTGSGDATYVTYNPGADTDPQAQDAAKIRIPFIVETTPPYTTLHTSIDDSVTTVKLVGGSNTLPSRAFKIDNEIMRVVGNPAVAGSKEFPVARGQCGTSAAAHTAGAAVHLNTNSLPGGDFYVPLREAGTTLTSPPVGLEEGHQYLVTWDVYWTNSYLNSGLSSHKGFQFCRPDGSERGAIYMEIRPRYGIGTGFNPAIHVASIDIRMYAALPAGVEPWTADQAAKVGPGVTDEDPLSPRTTLFLIHAGRWTRFWMHFDLKANDWDVMTLWMADSAQNPVKIYDSIKFSTRANSGGVFTINSFWHEWNTSSDGTLGRASDGRDFVSYTRNFVVLKDPGDISSLLVKP